jgi:hypothetical protein
MIAKDYISIVEFTIRSIEDIKDPKERKQCIAAFYTYLSASIESSTLPDLMRSTNQTERATFAKIWSKIKNFVKDNHNDDFAVARTVWSNTAAESEDREFFLGLITRMQTLGINTPALKTTANQQSTITPPIPSAAPVPIPATAVPPPGFPSHGAAAATANPIAKLKNAVEVGEALQLSAYKIAANPDLLLITFLRQCIISLATNNPNSLPDIAPKEQVELLNCLENLSPEIRAAVQQSFTEDCKLVDLLNKPELNINVMQLKSTRPAAAAVARSSTAAVAAAVGAKKGIVIDSTGTQDSDLNKWFVTILQEITHRLGSGKIEIQNRSRDEMVVTVTGPANVIYSVYSSFNDASLKPRTLLNYNAATSTGSFAISRSLLEKLQGEQKALKFMTTWLKENKFTVHDWGGKAANTVFSQAQPFKDKNDVLLQTTQGVDLAFADALSATSSANILLPFALKITTIDPALIAYLEQIYAEAELRSFDLNDIKGFVTETKVNPTPENPAISNLGSDQATELRRHFEQCAMFCKDFERSTIEDFARIPVLERVREARNKDLHAMYGKLGLISPIPKISEEPSSEICLLVKLDSFAPKNIDWQQMQFQETRPNRIYIIANKKLYLAIRGEKDGRLVTKDENVVLQQENMFYTKMYHRSPPQCYLDKDSLESIKKQTGHYYLPHPEIEFERILEKVLNETFVLGPDAINMFLDPAKEHAEKMREDAAKRSPIFDQLLALQKKLCRAQTAIIPLDAQFTGDNGYNHSIVQYLTALDPRMSKAEKTTLHTLLPNAKDRILTKIGDCTRRDAQEFSKIHSPFYFVKQLIVFFQKTIRETDDLRQISEILKFIGMSLADIAACQIELDGKIVYNRYMIDYKLPLLVTDYCIKNQILLHADALQNTPEMQTCFIYPQNGNKAPAAELPNVHDWQLNTAFACGLGGGGTYQAPGHASHAATGGGTTYTMGARS